MNAYSGTLDAVFGDGLRRLSNSDVQIILDLKYPRTDVVLRPLFFPCTSDFVNKILKGSLAVDPKYFDKFPLPRLTPSVTWKRATFNHRRPGFLTALTNEEYIKAFFKLVGDAEIGKTEIPKWGHFTRLVKYVSDPMKKVMQHVVYWYNPAWKYPERASNDLKTFNWTNTVAKELFNDTESPQDAFEKALVLLKALWDQMEIDQEEFAMPALDEYV